MMRLTLSAAVVAVSLSPALAYPSIKPRVVKNSSGLLPCYNYVVVGGGASGLTVANRLSENPGLFAEAHARSMCAHSH